MTEVLSSNACKRQRSDTPSIRDESCLFAAAETVKCAFGNRCVPCAYKIGTFDVALDSEFCKRIPNQRPELCPRSRVDSSSRNYISIPPLGYKSGMSVLTVGDGDFSFSLALARFGCRVVATSYEPKGTVLDVYKSLNVAEILAELEGLGATIVFSVDGTALDETLPTSVTKRQFRRIVWNFPCSAVAKGQDGQNWEMEFNKKLVNDFIKSSWRFCPGGQIFITHKTKPPFNQWKIDEVAVSNVPTVRYSNRVVFDRSLFPPYVPRKALDRKSFPCHDACIFIFEVSECNSRSFGQNNYIATTELSEKTILEDVAPSSMIPVAPSLILDLRDLFLCNVSTYSNQAKRTRT